MEEEQLCQDACAALDQLQFEEAVQIIRRAETLAPQSARVKSVKEYAVRVHHDQIIREEVEAALHNAQQLYEADDLGGARREVQLALAKYPGHKKLVEFCDAVELKLNAMRREGVL